MMSRSPCFGRTPPVLYAFLFLFLLYPQLAASDACGNSTVSECKNGGVCKKDGTCECPNGYAGPICETTAVSVTILVLVCAMPLITWTIVCCYGYKSYSAARARRRRRRSQRESGAGPTGASGEETNAPIDDEPPGYYQAVYENPQPIGPDSDPDWTSPPSNYLELPPHYEDLINAIKMAEDMPAVVIIQMEPAVENGECSSAVRDSEISSPEQEVSGGVACPQSNQNEDVETPNEIPSHMGATPRSNCESEIAREDTSHSSDPEAPGDEPSSIGTHSRSANEERAPPSQMENGDGPPLEVQSETASGSSAKEAHNQSKSEDTAHEYESNKGLSEDSTSSEGAVDTPKDNSTTDSPLHVDSVDESAPEDFEDLTNPIDSEEIPVNQELEDISGETKGC